MAMKKVKQKSVVVFLSFVVLSLSISTILYVRDKNIYKQMTYEMNTEAKYQYSDADFIEKGYVISYLYERYSINYEIKKAFYNKVEKGKKAILNKVYKTDKGALAFVHLYFDGKDRFEYVHDTSQHFGYNQRIIRATCNKYNDGQLSGCDTESGIIYIEGLRDKA